MLIRIILTWPRLTALLPVPLDGRQLLRRLFMLCPKHGADVWSFDYDDPRDSPLRWDDDIFELAAQAVQAAAWWHVVAQWEREPAGRADCRRDVLLYALADK